VRTLAHRPLRALEPARPPSRLGGYDSWSVECPPRRFGDTPSGVANRPQPGTREGLPLELRQYLDILKRHKWFILEAVVVVGLVAGILSSLRTPLYEATARVLLTPNDPTQQLNPTGASGAVGNDPDRYVAGQINIVQSEAVATEAAKSLSGVAVQKVESVLAVSQDGQSNVLRVSATDEGPSEARDIANAVARGYIENRRQAAVSGLQQAADDIQQRLGPLQAQIADLDSKIGSAGTDAGGTSALVGPAQPGGTGPPVQSAAQVDPGASPSTGPATTQEALKAARYAAAVQYETLYSRQQELLVDISLKRGDAELIAEAKRPTAPVGPHPRKDGVLGMSIGLLLGVGISVVREQFGDRVRSAQEVEKLTGLPMLAELPYDDAAKEASSLAALERPLGPLSESLRSLRTGIQYLGIDRAIKIIVVTSAVPGEGKSLVAGNLAAVFAQASFRTLLISADLRRSSVEALFGRLERSEGLTGVLAPSVAHEARSRASSETNGNRRHVGSNSIEPIGALVATTLPTLQLLPSGATPPNPAELLGSKRMGTVLATYAAEFDIIVVDTPPVLVVTDAAVLASQADGVLLVTAVNETRRDGLRRAKAVLDATGGRLLGTVVNKVTTSQGYYNYDSKYYGASRGRGTAIGSGRSRGRGRQSQARSDSPTATSIPTGA
jgi:Mrp family chromosome partitioning ATPase